MKNYTLCSEAVTERHNVKCDITDLPEVITEYAAHYGITAEEVRIEW